MRSADGARNRGFALVVVIWGLGVISLLIVSFMTTARWHLQAAYNVAGAAKAASLAEAAANIGVLKILWEGAARPVPPPQDAHPQSIHAGEPFFCQLPGAVAAIAIEDESGKVDLNAASPNLLKALFMGFGIEMREADRMSEEALAFRGGASPGAQGSPPTMGAPNGGFGGLGPGAPPPPWLIQKNGFQTALELDQVQGVGPALARALMPYVTTHSRGLGVDPAKAPPALFAALTHAGLEEVQELARRPYPNGLDRRDPRFPPEFRQQSGAAIFLVHAEVAAANGSAASRELIVDAAGRPRFAIKEARRGAPRFLEELRAMEGARNAILPSCQDALVFRPG